MTPSTADPMSMKQDIRAKVIDLAKRLGVDARGLTDTDNIPARAGLDSAAIMELIVWYEQRFGLEVDQDDLTMENFGTIEAMAAYAHAGARR